MKPPVLLVLAICLSAAAQSPSAQPNPKEVVIANVYHEAGGCQSTGKPFNLEIPEVSKLDLNYKGVVGGIEFRETTHVARAGFRDVVLDGNKLKFNLFADGQGSVQGSPCPTITDPFRMCPICVGGAGASIGYQVIAHYREAPSKSGAPSQPK